MWSCEKLCLNVFSLGVFKYMASTILYMQVGCTADLSIVCRLAKETSVCHGQPCFLFTFGIVHLERFEVRIQKTGKFSNKCFRADEGKWKQVSGEGQVMGMAERGD